MPNIGTSATRTHVNFPWKNTNLKTNVWNCNLLICVCILGNYSGGFALSGSASHTFGTHCSVCEHYTVHMSQKRYNFHLTFTSCDARVCVVKCKLQKCQLEKNVDKSLSFIPRKSMHKQLVAARRRKMSRSRTKKNQLTF